MEKRKSILIKLLFPPTAVVVLLAVTTTALLFYTFSFGSQFSPIAYITYALSFYALILVCARAPQIIRFFKKRSQARNLDDWQQESLHQSTKRSLRTSLGINLLYMLLQLGSGCYYQSNWFYTLAGYYALLAAIRFFLLKETLKEAPGENTFMEYLHYRLCGIILLLINIALAVMVTYIVWQNPIQAYNEILTIAMAAHTFYSMTVSVLDVLKYRHHESPVILAAKSVSLATALVSLLSLENVMLVTFSSGNDLMFRQIMTTITGAVVCLLVLAMAIYMIVRSTKEIKLLRRGIPKYDRRK